MAGQQNSNPYDNLAMIWLILRDKASESHPMSAKEVHDALKLAKSQGIYENVPARGTVQTLLEEKSDLMGSLFGRNVIPSQPTIQKFLRRQVEGSPTEKDKPQIACVAKNPKNTKDYLPYDTVCDDLEATGKLRSTQGSPTRYYYLKSPLSPGEWQIFSDLVRFSPWISLEQTRKFSRILSRLSGIPYHLEDAYYHFKREHSGQFPIIATLQEAIATKHMVSLQYGTHKLQYSSKKELLPKLVPKDKNAQLSLAPLSLVWANGLYYLICKYGEAGTMHLRVDRILSAQITGETFDTASHVSMAEHRDRSPIMYGGKPQLVRFTCPSFLLSTVMDFFGATPSYSQKEDVLTVTVSATFLGVKLFALQYIDQVTILEPQSLREEIRDTLKNNIHRYED